MKAIAMQTVRRMILGLFVIAMIFCAWLAPLDPPAAAQVDAGLKRALLTFATARALNAVISVAQGTEVSVQPLGLGVNFAPGQILDPVNDLVEQFSNLMLAASVAFGVQKALIGIGAWWPVSLALTAAALGWAGLRLRGGVAPQWLCGMLVVLLMVRFAVPAATLGTDGLFRIFLAADYADSQQIIDTASDRVAGLNPRPPEGAAGRSWWGEDLDVKARFEQLKQAAELATDRDFPAADPGHTVAAAVGPVPRGPRYPCAAACIRIASGNCGVG
jgi:hypothetical protein